MATESSKIYPVVHCAHGRAATTAWNGARSYQAHLKVDVLMSQMDSAIFFLTPIITYFYSDNSVRHNIPKENVMTVDKFEPKKLVRLAGVKSRTGLGKTKIYQLIRENKFPRPVHPADSRLSAWASLEIDAWIDEQVSASRQGNAK